MTSTFEGSVYENVRLERLKPSTSFPFTENFPPSNETISIGLNNSGSSHPDCKTGSEMHSVGPLVATTEGSSTSLNVTTGLRVGPEVGAEVGGDVGPDVGEDVGLEVGPDVGGAVSDTKGSSS